jgi:para-aminobenzoate synthetase component I
MIVRPLDAAEAAGSWEVAWRLGSGRSPCWLMSPGAGELGVVREYIACDPVAVVRGVSLPALEQAWQQARAAWAAGPETPVGVGYLSYDLGRQFDRLRSSPPPDSGWPLLDFRFYDAFWVNWPAGGQSEIWAVDEGAADRLWSRLGQPGPPGPPRPQLGPLQPMEPAASYLAGVARVLEYLRAGDVYQVNLARRLRARCQAAGPVGLALHARLTELAPAPFSLWLADEQAGRALVGNSPERFLRLSPDGNLATAPIKGTRPRGDAQEDVARAAELAAAPKDRAEHVMIVDLERNDLGRICQTGSVRVEEPMRLLSLPSVHHLVSTVRGLLRPGLDLQAILRATFPGGSITGAPKLRAMEIIDELEPACRGPYTGASGWLGAAGDFDLAIAIRTALVRDGELTLWVGGGIVADSSPEAELAETEVKAGAFTRLSAASPDGEEGAADRAPSPEPSA